MLSTLEPVKEIIEKSRQKSKDGDDDDKDDDGNGGGGFMVDDWIHWLHFRVTFALLVACSIINGAQEILTENKKFQCLPDTKKSENEEYMAVLNSYCWIVGGFSLDITKFEEQSELEGHLKKAVIHAGISHYHPDKEEIRWHSYYMWVPILLFGQACLFYAPRLLAKSWQSKNLACALKTARKAMTSKAKERDEKLEEIADFIFTNIMANSNKWALKMMAVTVCHLLVTLANVFVTNLFLKGHFWMYGRQVAEYWRYGHYRMNEALTSVSEIDPMELHFPTISKCTFHQYGSSGTVEIHDAFCVLPMNVVNRYIYLVVWFWLVVLTILTFLSLAITLLELAFPPIQRFKLAWRLGSFANGGATSKTGVVISDEDLVTRLARHMSFGDWRVMGKLVSSTVGIDPSALVELLEMLCDKLDQRLAWKQAQKRRQRANRRAAGNDDDDDDEKRTSDSQLHDDNGNNVRRRNHRY